MELREAFEKLLTALVETKGSDLFITAGWPPSIKVDGVIRPAGKQPLTPEQARDMVLMVMNDTQREEFLRTKECQFAISRDKIGRFRISALIQRDSTAMVLRRIETKIPTIEELKLQSPFSRRSS
jgi:twitching motility protein PilU